MCEEIDIKDKDDFLNFLKEKEIKTVLLGNSFSLSHPEFEDCFKFKLDEIIEKLREITDKDLEKIIAVGENKEKNKFDPQCPETSLEGFRKAIIEITIEDYMHKFLKKCHGNNKDKGLRKLYHLYTRQESSNTPCFSHCTHFLNNFETIFTTNYDLLVYFEILKHNEQFPCNCQIADGFNGPKPITIDDSFKSRHPDYEKRIYYVHGSWFIRYHKDENMLSKLSFAADSQHKISDIFNWEKGLVPYLIFEDRPWCKEYFTKEEKEVTYFKHCFEALENAGGPLLVFGMSFNKDDHIAQTLSGKKCYITYRGNDCNIIKEKFEKGNKENEKIDISQFTFVKLLDDNVIWDENC